MKANNAPTSTTPAPGIKGMSGFRAMTIVAKLMQTRKAKFDENRRASLITGGNNNNNNNNNNESEKSTPTCPLDADQDNLDDQKDIGEGVITAEDMMEDAEEAETYSISDSGKAWTIKR